MTAKAKAKTHVHSKTTTHGNTRTTVTRSGHTTTTTRSVTHGRKRVTTTTTTVGGKVVRTSRSVTVIGHKAHKATGTRTAKKRGTAGECTDGFWITGGNDYLATCVPVALANSRLIATGWRVPDWQVLALAGERSIADCLALLGVPFRAAESLSDGVILGVAGEHAVTVHDGAAVSWGAEMALDGLVIEEAWEVAWR